MYQNYLIARTSDLRLSVVSASILKYNKQQQLAHQAWSFQTFLTRRKSIKKTDSKRQWSNENWKVIKLQHKKSKKKYKWLCVCKKCRVDESGILITYILTYIYIFHCVWQRISIYWKQCTYTHIHLLKMMLLPLQVGYHNVLLYTCQIWNAYIDLVAFTLTSPSLYASRNPSLSLRFSYPPARSHSRNINLQF